MKLQRQGNIYLIGFMGCGKSTLAPLLAKRLKRGFFDTDDWIETQTGKSISELFQEYGEDYFRQKETQCVELISKMDNLVVALGGGAVLRPENWIKIKGSGITIYLKCSSQELWHRIKDQPEIRPLLSGDVHQKQKTIETLLAEREPYYAQAELIIESDQSKSAEEMVELIVEKLERLL